MPFLPNGRPLDIVLNPLGVPSLSLIHISVTRSEYVKSEVEVVRTRITLECTECKNRNYNMMKDKKTHPERMETKKYCKFCKSHTLHKETK